LSCSNPWSVPPDEQQLRTVDKGDKDRRAGKWKRPRNRSNDVRIPQQEAHMSQRGRAVISVIEYFPKSLKVIRNDILVYSLRPYEYSVVTKSLFRSFSYHFWDIQRQWHDLEIWVSGHARSLEMAPIDRSPYEFLFTFRNNYGPISYVTLSQNDHFEIKWHTGQKSRFFIPNHVHARVRGSPSEHCYNVWYKKKQIEWCGYLMVTKVWLYVYCLAVSTKYRRVEQTGQTDDGHLVTA